MEFHTILTVKEQAFEALLRSLRLYMEQDECVCEQCVVECAGCMYCIAQTAIRNIGEDA